MIEYVDLGAGVDDEVSPEIPSGIRLVRSGRKYV